ncbi:hypothetical protein AB0E88_09570 [Streptomyces sp. NPDC028635]
MTRARSGSAAAPYTSMSRGRTMSASPLCGPVAAPLSVTVIGAYL